MNAPNRLVSILLIFLLSLPALGDNWFDNNDSLTDLAHLAPSDSAIFAALDLSRTVSSEDLARMLKNLVRETGGQDAVEEMVREIGDVEELATVFGTRMSLGVVAPQGDPYAIFAWEVKQPGKAVGLLKAVGMIPNREADKVVKVGDSTFHFIGAGGFGIYGDYLIISNSTEALKSTLVEGKSLHDQPAFHERVSLVSLDQGLLFYGEVPDAFIDEMPELENLSILLASQGVTRREFLTQIYAILNEDGKLTRALLSESGVLRGEAARFIPKDWGFMASFHLGYVHRFMNHLQEDKPQHASYLLSLQKEVEEEIGVTLDDLLKVVEGEVSISSNGLQLLPAYYMGAGSRIDYKFTVTMPLKDSHATQALLRGAWKRLDLETQRLLDNIVVVSGAELCYVIVDEQLVMSYGPSALGTLRDCLELREGESLMSRPSMARYPISNGVAAAYLDLRPLVREAHSIPQLRFMQSFLLGNDAVLDSSAELTVQSDGLKLVGTGGMPLVAGTGIGAAYFLFGVAFDNAEAKAEVQKS